MEPGVERGVGLHVALLGREGEEGEEGEEGKGDKSAYSFGS